MMYETFTYDFVASGTMQDIQFRSEENNAYGTVLDNVSIAEVTLETSGVVPEPATWGLMLGGFMMVGVAARRRGRIRSIAA
ncbi:PEPxxWA-CTERM sorting domain-containing protein [Sphingosinicellaceae bacterium]|nr:PEPxxWA-CTERM sorting domain-containing protein [Sphingosinicellaceae bacterium]